MLWLTKNNRMSSFFGRFAVDGSSDRLEAVNGFTVLHCVTPLRVSASILSLNSSHAKAAPKTTAGVF